MTTTKELSEKLLTILETHESRCLDSENDRKALADALAVKLIEKDNESNSPSDQI